MKRPWLIWFLPVTVLVIGVWMNAVVCAANGGYMPVRIPGGCVASDEDWNHICMTAQTHLNFLGDWMTRNGGIGSPGDFLQDVAGDLKIPVFLAYISSLIHKVMEKR